MNAGDTPMVTTPHTTLTLDATEFARFLQYMTDGQETIAANEDTDTYVRTFASGCSAVYRELLGTLTRMVEHPDESPFVVDGTPVVIVSWPVQPAESEGE